MVFSPYEAGLLYPYSRIFLPENFGQFSEVDPFHPDLERFPLYLQSTRWTGTLDVGDALFIPACWYHAFRHEGGVNINVNFWWVPKTQFVTGITAREVYVEALKRCVTGWPETGNFAAKIAALSRDSRELVRELEFAL
ncbi:MAG: cupin-like domain-containing protein, partial [Mycobacterium sp.]|nr:cupin-like domain-containing protein [Mycobacterium sp.]